MLLQNIVALNEYCAVCFSLDDSILLRSILFCTWVRTMKHVECYGCCLCGHWIALCLINEKNGRWIKEWYKRRWQHTHTHTKILMTGLILSEWRGYRLWFGGPSFDGILKITPTVAKQILTPERQSLAFVFIHYTTLFGYCKFFWRSEIRKGYISVNWNFFALETRLLIGRQTAFNYSVVCLTTGP